MGLNSPAAKLLCAAKNLGADFTSVLMIGRQNIRIDKPVLRSVFSQLNISVDLERFLRENIYAEGFFRLLGATTISSLDYSSFQGAEIIHDMNQPLPPVHHKKYTMVFDGGSLEHIFNIPQALKNCMNTVSVGGHFVQVTNANNWMGHGFWQFSPELMFRVFSPQNGYEVVAVLLHEQHGRCFQVIDPAVVGQRVELRSGPPMYILTIAKRIADVEIFATSPQQSDYETAWASSGYNARPNTSPVRQIRKEIVKRFRLQWAVERIKGLRGSVVDRVCYREVKSEDLLLGRFPVKK